MKSFDVEDQSTPVNGKDTIERWKIMKSEYTTKYQDWPPQFQQPFRPPVSDKIEHGSKEKLDAITIYAETYKDHVNPTKTKCIRPKQQRKSRHHSRFDHESTYKGNFRNTYPLTEMRKPFQLPADTARLGTDDEDMKATVNQLAYRSYTPGEFATAKRNPIISKPERGAVFPVAESNPNLQVEIRNKRRDSLSNDRSKMSFQTTNKTDFGFKRPIPDPVMVHIIDERQRKWLPKAVPFKHRSTCQDDYTDHKCKEKPISFKPVEKFIPSELPFEHVTMYSKDFRDLPFKARPKPNKLKSQWNPSYDNEELVITQYRSQFMEPPKGLMRRKSLPPKSKGRSKGKFCQSTSYKENYLTYDLKKIRTPVKSKFASKYEPPKIKFQLARSPKNCWTMDSSPFREGAMVSEEGFQRFLDSIQPRSVMYGSNEFSRDKLDDLTVSKALDEFDRYWKYIPDGNERLDWALKIRVNPFWKGDFESRRHYMLNNAPKLYYPY